MRHHFNARLLLHSPSPPPPTVENRIYWRTSRSNWIACSVDRWSTISCEGWCIFTRPRWRAMEIWNRPTAWSIHASSSRSPTLDCTSWGGLLIAGRKSTRTITRFGGVSESFVLVQSNSFVGRREGGIIGGINREGKVGKAGGKKRIGQFKGTGSKWLTSCPRSTSDYACQPHLCLFFVPSVHTGWLFSCVYIYILSRLVHYHASIVHTREYSTKDRDLIKYSCLNRAAVDGTGIIANGKAATRGYSEGWCVQFRYNRSRDRDTPGAILLGRRLRLFPAR